MEPQVHVPSVAVMKDETLMLHLELRHGNDVSMKFTVEPDRPERRLHAPKEWRTFHEAQHRLYSEDYDHIHNQEG